MNWIWKAIIIAVIIILLGIGAYRLWAENRTLESEIDDLNASLTDVKEENRDLERRIDHFEEPENLLKELKSQFNYREEGEEMIIVVPSENGE